MAIENSPVFVRSDLAGRALQGRTADRLTDAASASAGDQPVIKLGELMMILDLHRQGLSISAIARQLGIDRKTVRAYLAKGLTPPAYKPRQPKAGILAPFETYLQERLATYPGLTAGHDIRGPVGFARALTCMNFTDVKYPLAIARISEREGITGS
jgi:hypothetical protein